MATNDCCHEDKKGVVVACRCGRCRDLFLYQNAAVLYLNVDDTIFANFGNEIFCKNRTEKIRVHGMRAANGSIGFLFHMISCNVYLAHGWLLLLPRPHVNVLCAQA